MAAGVVIQAGHVARTKGATGTAGEQQMTLPVANLAAAKLRYAGHRTKVVLADERWSGDADCFIAIHGDGSTNRQASGAVVGYPDQPGGVLAQAWKRAYDARGWPYGWKPDNWTPAIRGYYGYRAYAQCERRMVIEVGFMTNPTKDRPWIDDHHGTIAQSIADAVNTVYGTPLQEDDMPSAAEIAREVVGQLRSYSDEAYPTNVANTWEETRIRGAQTLDRLDKLLARVPHIETAAANTTALVRSLDALPTAVATAIVAEFGDAGSIEGAAVEAAVKRALTTLVLQTVT